MFLWFESLLMLLLVEMELFLIQECALTGTDELIVLKTIFPLGTNYII